MVFCKIKGACFNSSGRIEDYQTVNEYVISTAYTAVYAVHCMDTLQFRAHSISYSRPELCWWSPQRLGLVLHLLLWHCSLFSN